MSDPSPPPIAETVLAKGMLAQSLAAGLETLDQQQTLTFVPYTRVVLPLDGYVFWIKSAILANANAVPNASPVGMWTPNQPPTTPTAPLNLVAAGSYHVANLSQQEEDESFSRNSVVFTSEVEVQDLNSISPNRLYIATVDGVRFAFSQRRSFYKQADLYHYTGDAVYPALATQIIDDYSEIDFQNTVVSNSLPFWLQLTKAFPVYPSFLVPDNVVPPYASVHIDPADTRALQAAPYVDINSNHWQLAHDTVRITLYGVRNNAALDYLDAINTYSLLTGNIGLMNSPVPRDEKRAQIEMGVLAQKKTLVAEVSYYQTRAQDVARQLILEAFVTVETVN